MSEDKPPTYYETTVDTSTDVIEKVDGIPLVPQPSQKQLGAREQVDYAEHRRDWIQWTLTMGKEPDKCEGYSTATMKSHAASIDRFFRWLWCDRGCTTVVTTDDADNRLKELAFDDASQNHKLNAMKALKTYLKWRHQERGSEQWEPAFTFSQPNRRDSSGDALSRGERTLIREAALEYGSIPHYNAVDVDERDRWKTYLAQRFEKPKSSVTLDDWERANVWKYPSLM
jgi:hypothetical protein